MNVPTTTGQESAKLEESISYAIAQIQAMREAAKQVASLTSILPTIYFAMISFSDLHKVVQGLEALPFVLPAVPWIVSQILIGQIYLPQMLPEEELAVRVKRLEGRVDRYGRRLAWAYAGLVGGLVLLLIEVAYYLVVVPAPPK